MGFRKVYFLSLLGPLLAVPLAMADPSQSKLARPAMRYELIDLGWLGPRSYANDVNNSGTAVGTVTMAWGQQIGLRYQYPDIFPELGLNAQSHSEARGINFRGDVVGSSMPNPYTLGHAYLRKAGSANAIDLHPDGYWSSSAERINKFGDIVGKAYPFNELPIAFLWSQNHGAVSLPSLDESAEKVSVASDISDSSVIVGNARKHCNSFNLDISVPVVWVLNDIGEYEIEELPLSSSGEDPCEGVYPSWGGNAYSINASNQVVGYVILPGQGNRAALWSRDRNGFWELKLTTERGLYYDINNYGQKVGNFRYLDDRTWAGLNSGSMWRRATDLIGDIPGWDMFSFEFYSINDSGDIVGHAYHTSGGVRTPHAIMLKKR